VEGSPVVCVMSHQSRDADESKYVVQSQQHSAHNLLTTSYLTSLYIRQLMLPDLDIS